jgi:MFS family permease
LLTDPPATSFGAGARPDPSRNAFAPLLVTLGVQAMVSTSMMTVPVLAPAAAADLHVSGAAVGAYVSILYIGAMFSGLLGGALVPRFGAIRVSQACLFLCAAGLAMVAVGRVGLAASAALVVGFGYGPITPASSHILARNTPGHSAGLVFSIKQTGVPLGGAIAGLVVPYLVESIGWRAALLAVAASCLAVTALGQLVREQLDVDRQAGMRLGLPGLARPLRLVWLDPSIRALAFVSVIFAAMQMCLQGYLVTYLVRDLGFSLARAGATLSVANGAGVIGRIVWGHVSDRWIAPGRTLGLLGLLMAAGAAVTATFTSAWPYGLILAVGAAYGASAIGWNGVHLAHLARLAPDGAVGLATGGCLFFTFFGVVVGPAAFGALAASGAGYPIAYLTAGIPALLTGLRFAVGRPLKSQ